jgi:hypothetical protein
MRSRCTANLRRWRILDPATVGRTGKIPAICTPNRARSAASSYYYYFSSPLSLALPLPSQGCSGG